eukprot:526335-Pelagomonas_calceolata.AAC.1
MADMSARCLKAALRWSCQAAAGIGVTCLTTDFFKSNYGQRDPSYTLYKAGSLSKKIAVRACVYLRLARWAHALYYSSTVVEVVDKHSMPPLF